MSLFLFLFLVSFPIVSNGLRLSHERAQPTNYCGVRAYDNRLIGRVVGGRDALPGEVPFHAALFIEYNYIFKMFNYKRCGGVLISNRWVLTAAHCTNNWFGTLQVVLGENNTNAVENIYVHPDFDMQTLKNDIALLSLREPVQYNENIQPICLPEPGEDEKFYGLDGIVAGWGKLNPKSGELPVKMQVTNVPLIRYDKCKESYSEAGHKVVITESNLCAGYQVGGKDACYGDSGGPLMVNTEGHWVLAGIVSNGISCAKPGIPGVYTRVGYFLEWIKATIHGYNLNKL